LGRGHALSGVLFEESAMLAYIIEYDSQAGMVGKAFAALVSEIQAIDGFISMDDFQSQTRPQPGEF
jgi:hypothetical protein